jgi:glucose-6-phosphate isomerase
MKMDDAFFATMEPKIQKAFTGMAGLEKGAVANPDEKRMVGHYWLRNSALAPTDEIRREIDEKQLVMESLGKELDLDKAVVNQGITVLGNKGSTDQHSYVQQLREGLNDFFATFIEVQKDEQGAALMVEPNTSSGDFLHGFYLGTRQALAEKDRESITLTIKEVSPFTVGCLIALFERAVGLYANLMV